MRVRAVIVWAVTLLLALLAPEGADASQSMSTYARWIRVDYYGALNVTSSANATEIRGKYRRLALQYHPDKLSHLPKSTRRKAEENFKKLHEAYECLSNETKRQAYDSQPTSRGGGGGGGTGGRGGRGGFKARGGGGRGGRGGGRG